MPTHLLESLDGVVEHGGTAVGSDERGVERLLLYSRVVLVGLDQGFDVGETVAFREAADGELLGVAGGDRGGGVVGDV